MKSTTALFCLAVIAASAECASIGGGASFGGSMVFPRIPFLNAPPRSIFPSRPSPTTARPANNNMPMNNIRDLFKIPDPRSLIPSRPSSSSSPSFGMPSITGLSAAPSTIPGVNAAIQSARNHVQAALNITTDLSSGIQQAIAQASNSSDPAAAIATLAETVLNAYITAAENCPLLIIGNRVLQEGVRLAQEIAQAAANVIFGTTSTTTTTTESTSTSTDSTSTSTDSTSASTDSTSTSTDSTSVAGTSSSTDSTSTSTAATTVAGTSSSTDSTSTSTDATTAAGTSSSTDATTAAGTSSSTAAATTARASTRTT